MAAVGGFGRVEGSVFKKFVGRGASSKEFEVLELTAAALDTGSNGGVGLLEFVRVKGIEKRVVRNFSKRAVLELRRGSTQQWRRRGN